MLLLVPPALSLQAPAYRAQLDAGHDLEVMAETEARLAQDPDDALAWAARSQALTSLQRFAEARTAADRALALAPGLADALLARGLARAGTAIAQRNFSSLRKALDAMDDFRAAAKADPTLQDAWMSLGLAYEMLPGILGGSTRKALACAESLRRINPPRGDLLQALVLVQEDRWHDAEPYFGRALATAPKDPEIVAEYLDSLDSHAAKHALGEAGKDARLLGEAARLLPPVAWSARAVCAASDADLNAGRPDLAWQVVQEHLDHTDAPSLLRLQLGKVAARSGQHLQEGLAALDQVLREPLEGGSAGYPGAWWRKGQILKTLGRIPEARQAAEQALKLDPKHRGARELLDSLGN